MPSNLPAPQLPVTLRRRLQLLDASKDKWVLGMIAIMLILPFALYGLALGFEVWESWHFWVILAMTIAGSLYYGCVAGYERLSISESGLEYRSLARGPLAFLYGLKPDWRMPWAEIEDVALKKGIFIGRYSGARRRILALKSRHGTTRRLKPYEWYTGSDPAGLKLSDVFLLKDERFLEAVHASPIFRVLAERGLVDPAASTAGENSDILADLPGGKFDLTDHPGALVVLVGLTLLAGYAVLDGFFFSPWRYLESPHPGPFMAAGAVALVVAFVLVRTAPKLERWAMVGLFTAAAVGAVYPAQLRFNAASDADGPAAYTYRQVAVGQFEAVDDPTLPKLRFSRGMEFWEELAPAGVREFTLVRGALGFWQLDLAAVRAEQRDFYRHRED